MQLFVDLAFNTESISNILYNSDLVFTFLIHVVSCLVILLGYDMLKSLLIFLLNWCAIWSDTFSFIFLFKLLQIGRI